MPNTQVSEFTSDDVATMLAHIFRDSKHPRIRSLSVTGPCVTVTLIDGRVFTAKFGEVAA